MTTTRNRWLDAAPSEPEGIPLQTPTPARRPPCADHPDTWDLDTGSPELWHLAVRVCGDCPLLLECGQLVETLISRGEGPRAMIWAGIGYDNGGKIVENLDRYRSTPGDSRRPLRIIRTGGEPVHSTTALPAPARRIVLGRQLRRTGTESC